jgi:type IV pilus assembly protein PilC
MSRSVLLDAYLEGLPSVGDEERKAKAKIPWGSRTSRITERERADFFTQLSVLLEAKVTLHRALRILEEQSSSRSVKRLISELSIDVEKGLSFDQAMARHPQVFSQLMIVTAEVGQESGMLPQVLANLSKHIEKIYALKRKFTQAMAYPILVLAVAILSVVFLLLFIVPSFAEMFQSFQVDLPTSTKLVLSLSEGLAKLGPFVLVALCGLALASRRIWRSQYFQAAIDKYRFSFPMIGQVALKTAVARFCRTLGTMLHSEVSLIDALQTTERIHRAGALREEIGKIIECIRRGKTVAEPLTGSSLFPPMVIQMIAVGEETSELDAMLLRVAEYFERDLDRQIEVLSSVLEPLIIVVLGVVIAAILIAMYMPMFDLVNVLK